MSYAQDLTASLSQALVNTAQLSPPTPRSGSPTAHDRQSSSSSTTTYRTHRRQPSHADQDADRLAELQSVLTKLDPRKRRPVTAAHLAALVQETFPPFQGLGATGRSVQTESVEYVALGQLTIAALGLVLGELMREAGELGEEDTYWEQVESEGWQTGIYLLQTTPSRAISLLSTTVSRLRYLTTSSLHTEQDQPPSLLSLSTYRQALPPSLFLAALFPHLAPSDDDTPPLDDGASMMTFAQDHQITDSLARKTRKLLLLPLSPLSLTKQEVHQKRKALRVARDRLAEQIGALTLASATADGLGALIATNKLDAGAGDDLGDAESLKRRTWSTLRLLDSVLAPSPTMQRNPPPSPADVGLSLHHLLLNTLPDHSMFAAHTYSTLARPGLLTRSWPHALAVPTVAFIVARTAYNSRQTLRRWIEQAGETARGFLIDWVVEPVRKILETVRHGDDSLAIMGKETLRSDLASLERMVVDFGRDEYKMNDLQLAELAAKVRNGDLTTVLQAWEQDIKKPIRSAVGGSLIRTLLIQVQKVKVDVALATDGIEKMLRSQQLTFAFVGVAPSMLVLVGLAKWTHSLLRSDARAQTTQQTRRRNWTTVREIDALLSPLPSDKAKGSPARTQGLLLLSLQALRTHAHSRGFPGWARKAFLRDVRALEEEGTEAGEGERRVLVERLWRWAAALRWAEVI